jgi:hypothetical protein
LIGGIQPKLDARNREREQTKGLCHGFLEESPVKSKGGTMRTAALASVVIADLR